ncbi:exophilin-5 isoform X2 [Rhinatrema bivittatum]|uniref:exophilin-5 isoform X2 n=1 Tax=Rhinatrema bivittatum TaxID=194408 RepID=UPI00112895B8|nr:exophilin-5 isoform X2 [Rhinatrema bivittatum]
MTKVATGRLDLSFLNEEEASKILAVLERDERLKRAERDRVSKLQSAKRDIKWLHGVTGEWFEEIQRKKFRNDPDVSSMLKQPLAYKLKKPAQNDLMDFRMSRTKSLQSHKNASSSSSILGFRSPFTSLFSFRKPQSQQQRHSIPSLSGHSASGTEEKTKMEVSNTLQSKRTDNLFGTKPVLDDLDNKLAHEQTRGFTTHTTPRSYKSRGHYRSQYSMEGEYSDIWGQRKDYCKTSSMFLHEGRRKLSSNEEYRTCSTYRPWKFHDMYSNRHHTFSHHDHTRKDKFARSPSLCSISQSRPQSSPASFTTFSASSLHLPSLQQSNSRFLPSSGHQESKRKHVSSIMWNRPHCNESAQNRGILSKTQSLMELNSYDNQDTRPLPLQQNRVYEFYQSQSLYRRTMPKAYQFGRNQVTSPVFWDNSEHKQFYQSETGSNGRGISQEGIMEMETDRTWEAANKENHSYMNNIEKVPLPYKRSHSNPNNLLISVNEKQIAPANSTILHSQHNFASTSMLAGDDLVEEMKIDLDFQSLASENASNKEIAEEMRMPEISNSKADLQNQNSLSSNSTITLHSCAPDVSTTSASVESRNQIKLDEHHEGPVGNILDTDISVSQLQFPLTEGNTKMPFQAHLFENANMQLTRETHLPAFSNIIGDFQNSSHDGTLGASSACYFLDSRDQTKPSAQCNYSNMVMLGTDASNNDVKSLVTKMNIDNNTQMCVAKNKSKMDPLNRTGYCPANGMTVVTPQPIYSQAASRSTDIPNSHSSILASALQTPDNTNVLTVNILDFRGQSKKEPLQENEQASEYCETVYNEKDFKSTSRSNRYTSVLLLNESRHASPLSSLNQWKSFQRNSSEMNNMKLENMKRESTEKPTGPNSQTQEQSIVSRGLQMDAVNATGTTTVLSSSSSNALTDHKDLLPGFSKVSSEHSQSFLPDLSPSINFTYLNTPTVSSLNCKSTDPLNMGGKVPLTRCRSEENISFELNKKQIGVANEDHYSQPTESYAQNKNETTHAPSFSDAQDQQVISKKSLLLRKIFFSDPNNRQHTKLTISHKPSRLVLPDVKTTKEGNLNILVPDSLAQTSSNHEHPISVDTVPATSTLSQNLNLISANGNRENRLQNSPDLTGHKQMESQWSDKRTSSNEDVEPYYNIASSEVSSVSNEFAEQKRIHSAVPEEPFTIIPNVTECKPNNSNSPEKENKHLSSSGSRTQMKNWKCS